MTPTRRVRQGPPFFLLLPLTLLFLLLATSVPANAQQTIPALPSAAKRTTLAEPGNDLLVTNTHNAGKGSLRAAILQANARKGSAMIRFDSTQGPFGTPQTITLKSALPELTGELTIDGYIEGKLWQASGVTVSGANRHRVFSVAPSARVTLSSLTITEGHAQQGGGIANQGALVVKGVTLVGNRAGDAGGGIANRGGSLTVINSTLVDNRAGHTGGGLAADGGTVTVTNCTFSSNVAQQGGGLFSSGTLLLRNTILANSKDGADCMATGPLDPASTHNLIQANNGCGTPISTADPLLDKLGGYNGPTPTLPLGGGSPAINLGDNAAAVDEHGKPLVWDQRGNGDPRFVAGITDLGAFEVQAFPVLRVNTVDDTELRACTGVGADCSLRGAITLANAMRKRAVITFDPKLFAVPRTLVLSRPLPEVTIDLTIDARGRGEVTVRGEVVGLQSAPEGKLTLHGVKREESK